MKTFRDIIEESKYAPGTKAHFTRHVSRWLKNDDNAMKIDNRPNSGGRNSKPHHDAAEELEHLITKHYGRATMNHIFHHVESRVDIDHAWNHHCES